jgi:hypothetical protein
MGISDKKLQCNATSGYVRSKSQGRSSNKKPVIELEHHTRGAVVNISIKQTMSIEQVKNANPWYVGRVAVILSL